MPAIDTPPSATPIGTRSARRTIAETSDTIPSATGDISHPPIGGAN